MSRLTLAARIAASRFASTRRRETRRARPARLPIALRWRRRRKRPQKGRLGRAAAPVAAWVSQIHLHLNLDIGNRTSGAMSASPSAAAPHAHVHRHFHARLSELRRRDEVSSIARETHRTETLPSRRSTIVQWRVLAMRPGHLEGRALYVGRVLNPSSAAPAAALRAADALRARPTLSKARPTSFAVTSATHERTRFIERPARIRTREPRTFHRLAAHGVRVSRSHRSGLWHARPALWAEPAVRSGRDVRAPGLAARHGVQEATTSQRVPPGRPPELLWRSAPRPPAEIVAETRRADSRSTPALPTAPERAALQLKDFDGPLLDRLTDDVIRRVERRARIERERRGL